MSGTSRKELLDTADKLGIPWTNDTPDETIEALIAARERGTTMPAVQQQVPECHGLMWEASVAESQCASCGAKDTCLEKFVATTLPATMKQLGAKATPAAVANQLGILEPAIVYAIGRLSVKSEKSEKKETKKPNLKVVESPPEEKPAPAPAPTVIAPPSVGVGDEQDFDEPDPPEESKTEAKPSPPVEQKAEEAVATKKSKKSGTKEAKKPKETKAEKPANPQRAGAASPAQGPAKGAKAKSASRAKGQVVNRRRVNPWGEHTFLNRWERDMKRRPRLEVGQKLVATHGGKTHEAWVRQGYFEYNGHRFPTRYAMTKEITGTVERAKQLVDGKRPEGTRKLTNWSGPKFWKVFGSKGTEKSASAKSKTSTKKTKKSTRRKK